MTVPFVRKLTDFAVGSFKARLASTNIGICDIPTDSPVPTRVSLTVVDVFITPQAVFKKRAQILNVLENTKTQNSPEAMW